jgi:hypothetical protein
LIDAGTVSRLSLLFSATVNAFGFAADCSVTVQALVAPGATVEGVQASLEMTIADTRLIVAEPALAPSVAVTVALWLAGMPAAAVALNVALAAPAVMATDAGTVSNPLLLESVTISPPAAAACDSVTVQVLTPP